MNIATPSDYKLGPGDAVFIDIWGTSQKSISSTVSPEGEIDIEGFGPIPGERSDGCASKQPTQGDHREQIQRVEHQIECRADENNFGQRYGSR